MRESAAVVALLLLGSGLRLINLGHQSLWLDEFFSFFLAQKDMHGIIEGTSQDVLPPLFYMLLHVALRIGSDEFAARIVPALFSILTLPVIYILGKALFHKRVAFASMLLLAISPLHVLFAQEARMYTMFTFFSALSYYFFWRAWQTGNFRFWLLFSLAVTAALYTHSLAAFNLLAIDLFCLTQFTRLRKRWPGLVASQAISFILFLPWVFIMASQIPRLQSEFAGESQSLLTLVTAIYLFLFGFSQKTEIAPFALFAGLALVSFSLLSTWYAWRNKAPVLKSLVFSLGILLVPVAGVYIMSFVWPIFVLRRLLPASLGLLLLISWTIVEAKPQWLNMAAGISVAILMVASLGNYYSDPDVQKIPFRHIIEDIREHANTADVFIHATDTSALAFAYYAPELNSYFLAGDPDYINETNRGRAQKIAGLAPESLETIVAGQEQFWLVVTLDHNIDYQTELVEDFDRAFSRLKYETISGVDVLLYSATP